MDSARDTGGVVGTVLIPMWFVWPYGVKIVYLSGSFTRLFHFEVGQNFYKYRQSKAAQPCFKLFIAWPLVIIMSAYSVMLGLDGQLEHPKFYDEDLNDESNKLTPTFSKSHKFFGIPLTDSANNNLSWTYRMKKSPMEKAEFASDSNEATIPIDFNDAILNNSKKQVRLDRKSLMALYMELDEERSASAVAANNAMAMITRL
ncbi:hypothetical protein RJT34_12290 [Clitoria ternatea]|uniref:GTD-binding domain-containing protein n=1 Tax=Clitoria ternatea TaxID=43366 RepID=A0AAN9JNN2_CLITE